jgi:hypothetical protein
MLQVTNLTGFNAKAPVGGGEITFIGSSSGTNSGGGGFNLSLPGGLQENDLVLGIACCDAGSVASPTGYTSISNGNINSVQHTLSYKFMGGSPDTYFPVPSMSASSGVAAVVMVFRGVNTSTPLDTTTTTATGGSGDPDCPSITTVTDGAFVVAVGCLDDDAITSCTISGYSDVDFAGIVAISAMMAYKNVATAGAENPAAFVTNGDDAWISFSVALRPA